MTKTRLLLTGLLAGAVAFGTACKTDTAAKSTTTPPPIGASSGAGGAGIDTPDEDTSQNTNPTPEEGTRETEPGVHEGTHHPDPGTGGAGLEPEPLDSSLEGETSDEPLNPGAPATTPEENDGMMQDEGMREPRD
ncbi:MAG TPA: hypothetical protein VF794_22885 [Archangium sp.]|jgi:hypothetical protein|uniref:hypothetical protein n=1 Tax=Archangium sp. TaxID=1872627 RepID=UPI002EDA2E75